MAGNIKGITVEIGGNTTGLNDALKDVNKQAKDLQKELGFVEKALKIDPKNVEMLTQKQKLLTESVSNTADKLDVLKQAQKKLDEDMANGLEVDQEQYRQLQRQIVFTEDKLENLTNELKNFGSVGAQQIAEVGNQLKDAGSKVTEFGKGFSVISAGTGALLGGSIAAFKELDAGYDTIITKTGATGDALDDLNTVADNIFGSMPTDMETVGVAVGEINTRFGYTGQQLEDLSKTFIQFAEINGVDLNNSIGSVDKILEQFNMDASETGGVLDLITQKAQQTGISADSLMKSVQNNGATFKDMGLGVNEAIVLLAQFEANGVNVETAIKGLQKATNSFAKEGISMTDGMAQMIDGIKNAKTETEALALAQEVFGTKGANEMTKAIREGRISVDDLSASMGNYEGVVSSTFDATLDPIDQSTVAMNNLKLAGSQLGASLQEVFAPVLTSVVESLQKLVKWFGDLSPAMQQTIVVVLSIVTALGPLLIVVGNIISAVGTIMTIVPKLVGIFNTVKTAMSALNVVMAANPIGAIIVAITALIAIFVTLYNNCEWFRDGVNAIWAAIKEAFFKAWDAIKEFFTKTLPNIFNGVIDFVKNNWQSLLLLIVNPFAGAFKLLYDNCDGFREYIDNFVQNIKDFFVNGWNSIVEFFTESIPAWFESVKQWFSDLITGIGEWLGEIIDTILQWGADIREWIETNVPKFIDTVISFVKELPSKVWTWLVETFNKIAQFGSNVFNKAKEIGSEFVGSVVSFVSELPSKIWTHLSATIGKLKTWVGDMSQKGKDAIGGLISAVIDGAKSIPEKMLSIGKDIVNGVWNGIKEAKNKFFKNVKNFFGDIVDGVKDTLGIESPSKVFKREVGQWIPAGVAEGIEDNADIVDESLNGMFNRAINHSQGVLNGFNSTGSIINAMTGANGLNGNSTSNNYGQNTVNIYTDSIDTNNIDALVDVINRKLGIAY